MASIDGQTLSGQGADVQQMFRSVYGAQADSMWDLQHNEELYRRSTARSNPVSVAPSGQVTYLNTGQTVAAQPLAGQPAQGAKDFSQFKAGSIYQNPNGFNYLFDGRQFRAIRSGAVDTGPAAQVASAGALSIGLDPSNIGPDVLDTQLASAVTALGGVPPSASATGTGANGVTGPQTSTSGLTPDMLRAVTGKMSDAAASALAYSKQTGIVHEPMFDGESGRWTYAPVMDPKTGQPWRTQDAELQQHNIAEAAATRAYNQLLNAGYVEDPTTKQRLPTLALKEHEEKIRQFDKNFGINEGQLTGFYQGNATLEREKILADKRSSPRDYLNAQMFATGARGGLGGFQPTNQVASQQGQVVPGQTNDPFGQSAMPPGLAQAADTLRRMNAARSAGQSTPQTNPIVSTQDDPMVQAHAMSAPQGPQGETSASQAGFRAPLGTGSLGVPGGPDHIGSRRPDGTIDYFGVPNQAGGYDIPITAATRALMEGAPIPKTGAITNGPGGYANAQAVRQAANPGQWITRDFNALNPSEQEQARAVASFAGYDDADTDALVKKGLPGFTAPSGSGSVSPFKMAA